MTLLICTQAVDQDDLVLGFFHRWIEEFAAHFDWVEVICLKEGRHQLPPNVHVHSLGKEGGYSRLKYIYNFYQYLWHFRYGPVFVHMNEEYLLLGGWWWRLSGHKTILWRNHKQGSLRTRLASGLSSKVCFTSPEAFVAKRKNALQMPIGIDVDFFMPPEVPAPRDTLLFLGRLDPVKKVEYFLEALAAVHTPVRADMYGNPSQPDSPYARKIGEQTEPLIKCGVLSSHGGVPHLATRSLYQSHAIYVNLTPSGSFDKTIGEAMACGCMVVCTNQALQGILPSEFLAGEKVSDITRSLDTALRFSDQDRFLEGQRLRRYIIENHSLTRLFDSLVSYLST